MKTSARNRFTGTIAALKRGAVTTGVRLRIGPGETALVCTATNEGMAALDLRTGQTAHALIKASSVVLSTDLDARTSVDNRLPGRVTARHEGPVNDEITVALDGSAGEVVAVITHASADTLALAAGTPVCALIPAAAVVLAVDEPTDGAQP